MSGPGESSPEVIAYRLGQIESTLRELRDESITPAVYNAHRQAAIEADTVYRQAVESRFVAIEKRVSEQAAAEVRADESRNGMRLAVGLAIASPILVVIVGQIFPGAI